MIPKRNGVAVLVLLLSFLYVASADLTEYTNPEGKTIWDEAPDFSNDTIPPFPSLKNAQGQDLTIANLRGVHLFGWKGCTGDQGKQVAEAYSDFYKLAQQPAVYNNIDWDDQTTKDFFGPNSAAYKIPDDTRKEIQQIFAAAQQVYNYPWTWQPPWLGWRQLWIEVRCSSSSDTNADPKDKCGDRAHQPPQCPPSDPGTPVDDEDLRLLAFSEPQERYSRITFCNKFFDLASLSEAISRTKGKPQQNNLEYWNNRANTFFHEVTHLDYFMNADDNNPKSLSPEVFDEQFKYKGRGQTYQAEAYGAFNCKILRNWIPKQKKYIGYYTQRNADTYAYFALAKYVQSLIGSYPNLPSPGRIAPIANPRKSPSGDPLIAADDGGADDTPIGLIAQTESDQHAPGFNVPGCGGRYDGEPSDGVVTGGPKPPGDFPGPELKCHGVGGDIWMLSRDQAVSASEQFCKQDVKDKEYFQGSTDSVKLSAYNKDDSKALSTINDCVGNFKRIVDDCDGNDSVNNPHNYKFGGTLTTSEGWAFKLAPTAVKPTEDSCDVSYKFILDEFEVRGKNFPDAKLGANGEGLKNEIKGCGALTDWHFEWTPNDVKYQWYAKGHLPIGTKSCMGNAVQSAGGSSTGNCHGAG